MKKTIRYWLAFILSPIIPTIITYSVVVYLDFFEGLKIAWYTSHVFFIPFDLYYPLENDVWLDFLSFLVIEVFLSCHDIYMASILSLFYKNQSIYFKEHF